MNKGLKRLGIAAAAVAVVALVGVARRVWAQSDNTPDRADLRKIAAAYEAAINHDDMDALKPYLSSDFTATMATGHKVKGAAEFAAYWKTMKELVGIRPGRHGSYSVAVEPIDTFFVGDYAFSFGTFKESLTADTGEEQRASRSYKFNSNWYAVSAREGNQWKLVSGRVVVDPFHSTFSEQKLSEIAALASSALKKG